MTFRRQPPPSPNEDPPSVLLMRAVGDLQLIEGGEPITDVKTIALMCGRVWVDLPALIEVGIVAGYSEDNGAERSGKANDVTPRIREHAAHYINEQSAVSSPGKSGTMCMR